MIKACLDQEDVVLFFFLSFFFSFFFFFSLSFLVLLLCVCGWVGGWVEGVGGCLSFLCVGLFCFVFVCLFFVVVVVFRGVGYFKACIMATSAELQRVSFKRPAGCEDSIH